MEVFVIIPDAINIVLLLLNLHQMYVGIEIYHPVYSILFINLVSALIASISEILILTLVSVLKTTIIVRGCTTFSLLFHHWSWCIVSVLRYLYIIESNWLHEKIAEPWKLTIAAIISVYSFYFTGVLTNALVLTYNGWPFIETYDMETLPRIACTLTAVFNFILPLGVSCYYYFLLLKCRGLMGNNSVADMPKCMVDQENITEVRSSIANVC